MHTTPVVKVTKDRKKKNQEISSGLCLDRMATFSKIFVTSVFLWLISLPKQEADEASWCCGREKPLGEAEWAEQEQLCSQYPCVARWEQGQVRGHNLPSLSHSLAAQPGQLWSVLTHVPAPSAIPACPETKPQSWASGRCGKVFKLRKFRLTPEGLVPNQGTFYCRWQQSGTPCESGARKRTGKLLQWGQWRLSLA